MQKFKQKIAIVTLLSVLTVLLLYINFTIWGGSYTEGDIEDNIRQEMRLIGESHLSEPSTFEIVKEKQNLLSDCLIPAMVECALMIYFVSFIEQVNQYNCSKTLVVLSVRLNN